MANGRQFDPVAAASLSAINATQRSLRSIRQDTGAPELPGERQGAKMAKQGIQSVAQFSPANVLARGNAPSLPGASGGLPSPNQLLPSTRGGPLPSPAQVLPGTAGNNLPDPNQMMPNNGGDSRKNRNTGGGETDSAPGDSEGSRDARASRSRNR